MSNKEGFNQFRFGMGVLAETLSMFHCELLKSGFSSDDAIRLTEVFLRETILTANNKEEK